MSTAKAFEISTVGVQTGVSFENILVATDFSPCSEAALPYALGLAKRYGSKVYTAYVMPHQVFVESAQPDLIQARRTAERKLAEIANMEAIQGIKHGELIREGEVPEVIANLIRQQRIDLLVMGTSGRKGVSKLLLGSVAEVVFRTAECPVLTIGPRVVRGPKPNGTLSPVFRQILFATDFGPESVDALPFALSLAEENRARLTLLHVSPEPLPVLPEPEPGGMPIVVDTREVVKSAEGHLRRLIPEGAPVWHEPTYMVQFGPAAETILKFAEQNVDLIVLGVKRPGALTKHLGAGVAYKVVSEAPCPVLTVGPRFYK
jgi:nucleotide-binding universal stress UspA family protein